MTHINRTDQKQVSSPRPAFTHVGSFPVGKTLTSVDRMFPFPERVNKKVTRIYDLMVQPDLNSVERKELKLLLVEDRVMAFHASQQLLAAENWQVYATKPGIKILLKKAPIQVISELCATLEIALLMPVAPRGVFEMVLAVAKANIMPNVLLMYAVGHPQLPQYLEQDFHALLESYASGLTS